MSKIEQRNNTFLMSINQDEIQRKHNDFAVKMRRDKRKSHTSKRRANITQPEESRASKEFKLPQYIISRYPALESSEATFESKLMIIHEILDTETSYETILEIMTILRTIMSSDDSPFDIIVSMGFIELLLKFVNLRYHEHIIYESSWCLCNLLAGTHEYAERFIKAKGVETLISAISYKTVEVNEHIIWSFANLAGDCEKYRQIMLKWGIMEVLYDMILGAGSIRVSLLRLVSWCLNNLSKSVNLFDSIMLQTAISGIKIMLEVKDEQITFECLTVIARISTSSNEKIQLIIDSGLIPYVLAGLEEKNQNILGVSIKLLGMICSGTSSQTQFLLNQSILDKLSVVTDYDDHNILKDFCWTLSNIAAGTQAQCETLVNHKIIQFALQSLINPNLEVKREASVVFLNIVKTGTSNIKLKLVSFDIFSIMAIGFEALDLLYLTNLLLISEHLLRCGESSEGINPVSALFEESGCFDKLIKLEHHNNTIISEGCSGILHFFFGMEEDDLPVDSVVNDSYEFT
ncbi:unnamed protein product [Blepharisma stoltei]|uniref:Importin subunit alpha n=1 Tax=Blepharisma stoltei TaxID=1481888 RepID=A0AAU9K4T4_9CILI|nr:unnamed protein product [Blepharisma stoltei]